MPAARVAAGKPERGTIRLSAWHEGGHIIIEVSDDGRGLDTDRIKATAIARGLASETEIHKMSDAQIQKFIFVPGFSTASKVTSVSGRGVGMDVVRANIDQIGGTIDVKSVFGQGTNFMIKIPLTLAIVSALIVQCAGDRFAIPQLAVVELVRARKNSEHRIERIKDAAVLRLRKKLLPLVHLKALLKIDDGAGERRRERFHRGDPGRQPDVRHRGRRRVPHRRNRRQADVEQAAAHPDVLRQYHPRRRLGDHDHRPERHRPEMGTAATTKHLAENARDAQQADDGVVESMLVFRAGSPHPKAVPLSLVTRLEEIDPRTIEIVERPTGRAVSRPADAAGAGQRRRAYQGARARSRFWCSPTRAARWRWWSTRSSTSSRNASTSSSRATRAGILGSAVIKGQATEIIDVAHFLPLAFEDWLHWRQHPRRRVPRAGPAGRRRAFFRNMLTPVLKAAGFAVTAVGIGR